MGQMLFSPATHQAATAAVITSAALRRDVSTASTVGVERVLGWRRHLAEAVRPRL